VPDLYVWQMPLTNAMAIGSKKPIVVLNSGTINLMDENELRTVLGHEAGHILSDHVLYQTALYILLTLGAGPLSRLPFFAWNLSGATPNKRFAPASKSARTPSQSRNTRGSAIRSAPAPDRWRTASRDSPSPCRGARHCFRAPCGSGRATM